MIRLLEGDCRVTLPTLDAGSVQACITSPPYYGLRDYGLPPLVWGGDPECAHYWGSHRFKITVGRNDTDRPTPGGRGGSFRGGPREADSGTRCACGAWLGSLGLEPSPEIYIEHLVDCFREVRRVLSDTGVCFLNLGDSYAGSGKGPTGHNGIGDQGTRQGFTGVSDKSTLRGGKLYEGEKMRQAVLGGGLAVPGAKPKDLLMMPFRVAMALQADGWWLRSVIPWLKRNSMPESVTDRPATSVEYVFLLAKSSRYFWDADAVRVPHQDAAGGPERFGNIGVNGGYHGGDLRNPDDDMVRTSFALKPGARQYNPAGRNLRNGDFFFMSWQGLLADEDGDPLAMVVNPQPFKGSHFATFPPKLVEPMVKASTSEKGQCPECGAPWVRQRQPTAAYADRLAHANDRGDWYPRVDRVAANEDGTKHGKLEGGITAEYITTGWQPTCKHDAEPVPQTILDPFGGSGTVGLVADRLGRNAVLCELKPSYTAMGTERIVGDAPMFAEVDGPRGVAAELVIDKQAAVGKRTYSGFNTRWDAREAAD